VQKILDRSLVTEYLGRQYSTRFCPTIWSLTNEVDHGERSYSLILWVKSTMTTAELKPMSLKLAAYLSALGYPKGEILLAEQLALS